MQQVGAAIGIAAVGALFFALAPSSGPSDAFRHTLWPPIGMFAAAFAATFLLPRRAAHRDPV